MVLPPKIANITGDVAARARCKFEEEVAAALARRAIARVRDHGRRREAASRSSHAPPANLPRRLAEPHSVNFGSTLARRGDPARAMEQLAASTEGTTNAELAEYYLSDEFRTQYMKVRVGALGRARGGGRA